MTAQHTALRYDRSPELEAGKDSLHEIAGLVAAGSTVLDLGTATGALGHYLHERKDCVVDGVEIDAEAAERARPHYRKLVEADLEVTDLAEHFTPGSFDVVVCADVLEHLRNPEHVLAQLPSLLAPKGRVLLSVPNIGYAGVIAGLLGGEFQYRPTGLLDEQHVRFFTRSSLLKLLREHGLTAKTVKPIPEALHESEFRDARLEALPPAVRRALIAHPDAFTFQFIVEAQPGIGPEPEPAAATASAAYFRVQLFWSKDSTFDEQQSVIGSAVLGQEEQRVELKLPPLAAEIHTLRLDVADRPGYVHLRALTLCDAAGKQIWEWDHDLASLRSPRQVLQLAGPLGGVLLCYGEDPSVELPLSASMLKRLRKGGTLRVELDWPMSSDYLCAMRLIGEREGQWGRERAALLSRLEAAQAEAKGLRNKIPESVLQQLQQLDGLTTSLARQAKDLEQREVAFATQIQRVSTRLDALGRTPFLLRMLGRVRREVAPARWNLTLQPMSDPQSRGPGEWEALSSDPSFKLKPQVPERFPSGWVMLMADLRAETRRTFRPVLYVDVGTGMSESHAIHLPPPRDGLLCATLCLPPGIVGLRFDPIDVPGTFHLSWVAATELGNVRAGLRILSPLARELVVQPAQLPAAAEELWGVFRHQGMHGLKHTLIERMRTSDPAQSAEYHDWVKEFDTLTEDDRSAIAVQAAGFARNPLISVVMPVYNTPEKWLRRAIESVKEQLYPHWELCIADDASTMPHVRRVLEQAAAAEPRIKVTFRKKNGHISAASNSALALASGEFVALLDHDDELAPHALHVMASEILKHPDVDLVYSDEDKINAHGDRYDPHFKPDWNPDLLHSINYVAHLACFRSALLREVGGFRAGFDGSQDFDLTLRFSARTKNIRHVPHVLYHWRAIETSTAAATGNKGYAVRAGLAALRDLHPDCEISEGPFPTTYRVRYPLPSPAPKVSLLIPTRDGYRLLEQAVRTILEKTAYPDFEIIIVDNQTSDPKTLGYLRALEKAKKARVLRHDAPFNYSAINNLAVREARGELVGLLNNDIEVVEPDWLTEMVSHAVRPEIGAVGCKLVYPSETLQHAGVMLGIGGVAGHIFRTLPMTAPGYFSRAQLTQNLSACTAACLVLRKSVYQEVGGLDEEHLRVAFNDVDFCLRLVKAGYRNLYTPFATLRHHESASRGPEDTPAKRKRFAAEVETMRLRWGTVLDLDPAYNPNLSLQSTYAELAWPPRCARPWKAQ